MSPNLSRSAHNPFSPPDAIDPDQDGLPEVFREGSIWRKGKVVVMRKDAGLPSRCIKCNRETDLRPTFKLYWHHPGYYFFLLVNLLVYAIVALIVRRRASIAIPLCAEHNSRRKRGRYIVAGSVSLLFGGSALGIAFDVGEMFAICLIAGLIGIIVGSVQATSVRATMIDDTYVHLSAGKPFLESLPDLPTSP